MSLYKNPVSRFTMPLSGYLLNNYFTSYRLKMKICKAIHLSDGDYYLCPRCTVSLDRDFQAYCDRCGQRLDWSDYTKSQIVYPMVHYGD